MIPPLPDTTVFSGKSDKGKKVTIRAGCLKGLKATVIAGPYIFTYKAAKKDIKGRSKEFIVTSSPYWQIYVEDYNLYLNFIETEIQIV